MVKKTVTCPKCERAVSLKKNGDLRRHYSNGVPCKVVHIAAHTVTADCPSCKKSVCVTINGNFHTHGPVKARCTMSGKALHNPSASAHQDAKVGDIVRIADTECIGIVTKIDGAQRWVMLRGGVINDYTRTPTPPYKGVTPAVKSALEVIAGMRLLKLSTTEQRKLKARLFGNNMGRVLDDGRLVIAPYGDSFFFEAGRIDPKEGWVALKNEDDLAPFCAFDIYHLIFEAIEGASWRLPRFDCALTQALDMFHAGKYQKALDIAWPFYDSYNNWQGMHASALKLNMVAHVTRELSELITLCNYSISNTPRSK